MRQSPVLTDKKAQGQQLASLAGHAAIRTLPSHAAATGMGSDLRTLAHTHGYNFANVPNRSFSSSVPANYATPSFLAFPQRCPFGGACHACPVTVQAKLAINQPGDSYEQEADRMADLVMETPAHHSVSGAPSRIQRFAGQSTKQLDVAFPSVGQTLASPGRPLEPALRKNMEERFGYDFSRVRVHSGAAAEKSAREINAHAYTVGKDIVFGAGVFSPGTHEGRRLIAHELTHVVQQVPHIARQEAEVPKCIKGHRDGQGQLIKPLTINGETYRYMIWGVWQKGDNIDSFHQRAIDRWIPWRFGSLAAGIRTRISTYLRGATITRFFDIQPNEGCNYSIGLSQDILARTRILSGEVVREQEAKKAAEAKAQQEQSGVEGEAKDSAMGGLKVESMAASGGRLGLGELEKPVEESKKRDLTPTTKVESDLLVLQDPQLADRYLKILEHFAGRSISADDTTAAADGLSEEELEKIIKNKPLSKILTGLFTQGYREFKAAGGIKNEDFFKLEEAIAEQFVRGNPTSTHNNLKIGYGVPEKEVLGIIERSSGILFYDANGQPLPGFAGVGMRDKGYIGSRQDDSFGINIAKIKDFDEGLFLVLNSLRQTFSDPTRMSKEAAEIYFQNVELVNAEVQKGLPAEVWNKFQEMLPCFIGFLAGHALSTWLLRVPNPVVAGVGLTLKALLTAAGYIMEIEFGAGALENLLKAAYDLSRIGKNDKGEITKLSGEHLTKAAVPIRSMVADIALMAATIGLAELLRSRQPAKIECTKCNIKTKETPKRAQERAQAILNEFAEAQQKGGREELKADILEQPGIKETKKPGGASQPQQFDVGNFSHQYAEQLIPPSKLPRNLNSEFRISEAHRRIDRVDWKNGKLYEVKPDTPSQIRAGEKQIRIYKAYMDKYYPLSGGRKWQGEVVTYNKAFARAFLKYIGWLE